MAQDRTTSIAAEVLHTGNAAARTTAIDVEVLHSGDATARVTSIAIEILVANPRLAFIGHGRLRHREWTNAQPQLAIHASRRRFSPVVATVSYTGSITLLWGV